VQSTSSRHACAASGRKKSLAGGGGLAFEHLSTAAQIGDAVKGGEVSLDDIQAITEDAQRIAADLDGFGRASAVLTEPAEAAKPVEVKKSIPGNPKERPRTRIR